LVKSEHPFDTVDFVPRVTAAGRAARLLEPLRLVVGDRLPSMPGANTLGAIKSQSVVLWEHPTRSALPVKTGGVPGPMPILAIGEAGDGRVVTLGTDGSHRLAWGKEGLATAGRAYGAFWDGLLGWVMRERRFESALGEIDGICIAGIPAKARVSFTDHVDGEVSIELRRLESTASSVATVKRRIAHKKGIIFDLPTLVEGGYSGLVRIGDAPAARFDFACERGGKAWSDSRPDKRRLIQVAKFNGGKYVTSASIDELPIPVAPQVTSFRQITPWLPTWVWALGAATALAIHWLLRRLVGLS
jgi:hypothetical protein